MGQIMWKCNLCALSCIFLVTGMCKGDPPEAPHGSVRLPVSVAPTIGYQVKYRCGGAYENDYLLSTCLSNMEWSEIYGECPEDENELDPVYTGNYQIGRTNYEEEKEEEEDPSNGNFQEGSNNYEQTGEGDAFRMYGRNYFNEEQGYSEENDIDEGTKTLGKF